MRRQGKAALRRATPRVLFVCAFFAASFGDAGSTDLFKCGSTFQDRPCESRPTQQRFSRTEGSFSIEQVNPDTDRDCARAGEVAIGWWNRLVAGESLERLHAEIRRQPHVSRYEKSQLRDALTALGTFRGPPVEVRSQFEFQCMAYKRKHGFPTEREVASGAASLASEGPGPTRTEARGHAHSQAAALRAEAAARRAAVEAQRARR